MILTVPNSKYTHGPPLRRHSEQLHLVATVGVDGSVRRTAPQWHEPSCIGQLRKFLRDGLGGGDCAAQRLSSPECASWAEARCSALGWSEGLATVFIVKGRQSA